MSLMKEGDIIESIMGRHTGRFFSIVKIVPSRSLVRVRRLHRLTMLKLNLNGKFARNYLIYKNGMAYDPQPLSEDPDIQSAWLSGAWHEGRREGERSRREAR